MYDESKYGRCEICGGKLKPNWYVAEDYCRKLKFTQFQYILNV